MDNRAADAVALWAVHTHLMSATSITPRLAITSPTKRCGKTTLLDVLARLVWRPLPTADVTAAALFRSVEAHSPTLLVDEGDAFLSGRDELRGILNSGHRASGAVLRTAGEDHEPRQFATYAAVAIACIGRLPFPTLEDRSIIVTLRRRRSDEAVEQFRHDRTATLDQLARQIRRWASDNEEAVNNTTDPAIPAGIYNRLADNWRPLLAIADTAGGEWSGRARCAARQLIGEAPADPELGPVLLANIRSILVERGAERADRISSEELVARLVALEGRPWADMHGSGHPLTRHSLARLLKPFGIAPSMMRQGDKPFRGYQVSQFDDAFGRYIPAAQDTPSARGEGLQTVTSLQVR
jgi:putative DNA primase/helicase